LDLEPVLFKLRKKGADKIDSIKIVNTAMNVSTAQAKSLVDCSEAWSDRYADDIALHASVREAAEKLKNEADGTEVVIEERSPDPDCR
jgi:ribosomal protein L7/L12